MKVQTNAGEVELTPDMVRPGMAFQSEHWRCADAPDGVMVMARPSDVWCGDEQGWMSTSGCGVIASTGRFLGCDPTIATREDVERYGVAPGIDAGAHGFARLRGGGAVDLRRGVPMGGVVLVNGHRVTTGGGWAVLPERGDRFVGLDTRPARHEDVERLCCGASARCADYPNTKDRCTLAIGAHAEHEDIATGTRWPAKVALSDASRWTPVGGEACCACGGVDGHWMCLLVDGRSAEDEHDVEFFAGEMGLPAAEVRAGLLATAAGLGAAALLSWICGLRDGRPCDNCEAMREHGEVIHHESCSTDGMAAWQRKESASRRTAEEPLVALVAAVPEGLDPIGWRAAVLAVHEASGDRPTPDTWAGAECEKAIRIMVAIGIAADAYSDVEQIALDAYARAVAPPGPRPVPERRRLPGLPLDMDD